MSIKKSIGWCDMTLNPIKGRCKGGCWYCFYSGKRGIMDRFGHEETIRINLDVFEDQLPKIPKKVFLCSTHDLFGSWIDKFWRDVIFRKICHYSQHTFQILTKFPENIDRPMPDNVWLGVTVTRLDELGRLDDLYEATKNRNKPKVLFVSFEPLLELIGLDFLYPWLDWAIIGRLTGHGKKYNPSKDDIQWLIGSIEENHTIPIFLKDNLKEIWGEPLIQEFPK